MKERIEILKCKENPYYFATTYLTIKTPNGETVPYTTRLSEEIFNKIFKELQK